MGVQSALARASNGDVSAPGAGEERGGLYVVFWLLLVLSALSTLQ